MSKLRGLRVAVIGVFVASLALGAHAGATGTLAVTPTATETFFPNLPETWLVNQALGVQVNVWPVPDAGTVELKVDGATFATQSVGVGYVSFLWTPDTKKTYELQAFYSGSANYAASQSAVVDMPATAPPPTNVSRAQSKDSVALGEDVQYTATVTPNPGAGNVEWRTYGSNDLLATTAVDGTGSATWTTSFDTPGQKAIRARWAGNVDYGPKYSDPIYLDVIADALTLSVSVPGTPLPPGHVIADVALDPNPGTGVIEWKLCDLGGYCPETEVAVDPDGTTSIDIGTFSTVTDYNVYVRYPAQGIYGEAKDHASFSIWNATSTSLATDRNVAYVGELPVKLSAAVDTPNPYAGGSITFLDDVGGDVVELGPVAIDTYTHNATFSSSSLRIGTHSIRAKYSGEPYYLASTSDPVTVTVGGDTAVHATFAPTLRTFYPSKDGFKDTVKLGGVLSERASVTIKVYNSAGTLKRSWSLGTRSAGSFSATWNGKTSGGASLPAGTYTAKATIKDTHGHSKTLTGKTTISWRQVTWHSVSVLKYAEVGSYYVGEFGGAIYYSPDYSRGRILDSGEMIRDCTDCGFAAGQFVFTVKSTSVLAYRKLYVELRGHDFTDREHPGSHALVDPATGHLALIGSNYPLDDPDVHWGIPFTSRYIDSSHHVEAWVYMTQAWGDAYDLDWLRLTYQYAVWK